MDRLIDVLNIFNSSFQFSVEVLESECSVYSIERNNIAVNHLMIDKKDHVDYLTPDEYSTCLKSGHPDFM